jgi:hypothetical protein
MQAIVSWLDERKNEKEKFNSCANRLRNRRSDCGGDRSPCEQQTGRRVMS